MLTLRGTLALLFTLLTSLTVGAQETKVLLKLEEGPRRQVLGFGADGKTLAIVAPIGKNVFNTGIRLWSTATGRELASLQGPMGGLDRGFYSPSGASIATTGGASSVTIWNAQTGRASVNIRENIAGLSVVSFSGDGKILAACGDIWVREMGDQKGKGIANLWDTATGKLRGSFRFKETVSSAAISPDGKFLAVAIGKEANKRGDVLLVDVKTGKEKFTMAGHKDFVLTMAFAAGGKALASASRDHTVILWDVETGKARASIASASAIKFSPDGKVLMTSENNSSFVSYWDTATGKTLALQVKPQTFQRAGAFSPDSKTLAVFQTRSQDKMTVYEIVLWDLPTLTETAVYRTTQDNIAHLAFSTDAQRLFGICVKDWALVTWDVKALLKKDQP